MSKVEQKNVVKFYTLPYSWTWKCGYCEEVNSGDTSVCDKCNANLWEEDVPLEAT